MRYTLYRDINNDVLPFKVFDSTVRGWSGWFDISTRGEALFCWNMVSHNPNVLTLLKGFDSVKDLNLYLDELQLMEELKQ